MPITIRSLLGKGGGIFVRFDRDGGQEMLRTR
jgi:hypothetical protein